MHPSNVIKGIKSQKLKDKKIILGITGSIACIECVKLARELIRHGADVIAVMSKEACRIISPLAMEFATGKEVIIELSGKVEHISIEADLLLIAPCTANTISKIAFGIADNAITTFAVSFKDILIAPSMHISMYENLEESIEKCKSKGIEFIEPKIDESKAKMAEIEEIVEKVIRKLRKNDKKGKKVLVIGGGAYEYIDNVRVITNLSSGKMAKALVKELYERGADVEFWHGKMDCIPYIKCRHFECLDDIIKLIEKARYYDAIINCAALPDFKVNRFEGKMPSDKEIEIKLFPVERINPMLKRIGSIVIGFKLEEKEEEVVEKAMEILEKDKLEFVIGNLAESIGKEETKIWIVGKEGLIKSVEGKKEDVAKEIVDLI